MVFRLGILIQQILASVFPLNNRHLRLSGRRLRFLVVFIVLFVYGQISSHICLLLDHLFFPRFRRVSLKERTLFIVGNFRSGSTFLQRLLAADEGSFRALKTWEIYLAPSIIQRRALKGLKIVDGALGGVLYRALRRWDYHFLQQIPMHPVSLWKPEEDDGLLFYTWYSFLTWFFFPMEKGVDDLIYFDQRVSGPRRHRIIRFYAGCLKRVLYTSSRNVYFLSKNPSFTSKMATISQVIDRPRFIVLGRPPADTVSSTLGWFSYAWHFFASPAEPYPFRDKIVEYVAHWFDYPLQVHRQFDQQLFRYVRFADLVGYPEETVRELYDFLGLRMSDSYVELLRELREEYRHHRTGGLQHAERSGLSRDWLNEVFRATIDAYGFPRKGRKQYAGVSQLPTVD